MSNQENKENNGNVAKPTYAPLDLGAMGSSTLEAVKLYLKLGWLPIPVKARTKQPAIQTWRVLQDPKKRPTDEKVLSSFKEGDNIAVLCG